MTLRCLHALSELAGYVNRVRSQSPTRSPDRDGLLGGCACSCLPERPVEYEAPLDPWPGKMAVLVRLNACLAAMSTDQDGLISREEWTVFIRGLGETDERVKEIAKTTVHQSGGMTGGRACVREVRRCSGRADGDGCAALHGCIPYWL